MLLDGTYKLTHPIASQALCAANKADDTHGQAGLQNIRRDSVETTDQHRDLPIIDDGNELQIILYNCHPEVMGSVISRVG